MTLTPLTRPKALRQWFEQVDVNRIEQDLENSIQGHKTNGYFPSPSDSSFQTMTMAMQRAKPTRMTAIIYSG